MEIGIASNLTPSWRKTGRLLACDLVLNPDSGILDLICPPSPMPLRGLGYFEAARLRP